MRDTATPAPGIDALVLHPADNVATALHALAAGQTVRVGGARNGATMLARDAIDLCHKIALCDIPSGAVVVKYGESIGQAVRDIHEGEHVHTLNLHSLRGRRTVGRDPDSL